MKWGKQGKQYKKGKHHAGPQNRCRRQVPNGGEGERRKKVKKRNQPGLMAWFRWFCVTLGMRWGKKWGTLVSGPESRKHQGHCGVSDFIVMVFLNSVLYVLFSVTVRMQWGWLPSYPTTSMMTCNNMVNKEEWLDGLEFGSAKPETEERKRSTKMYTNNAHTLERFQCQQKLKCIVFHLY